MKKKIKITFNAPVTLGFAFVGLVVTILGIATGGGVTHLLFSTYRTSLLNPLLYVRLFTHVLGHQGMSHFIGNATYLLLLGPLLEEKYGSISILETMVITAFVTGLFNNLVFNNVALCGASGIVFAFIVLSSFTNFKQGEIPLSFILVFMLFVGQQVFEGLFTRDNVSQISHILGGLVGGVIGYYTNKQVKES